MKLRIFSAGLVLALVSSVPQAIAQYRRDRPDFYEEGQQQLEREIERLNKKPSDNLLTIQEEPQKWLEFTLQEGGFAIWMPGEPTQQKNVLATADGMLELRGFALEKPVSRFAVAYGDYPAAAQWDNTEAILADAATRIAEQFKGYELTSDRSIALDNYSGKEFNLQRSGELLTFRVYLVKQRLYILAASQKNPQSLAEDIVKFFDSFRLL